MIHLTPADYRRQPWANGRGSTMELYREDHNGALQVRLSMAAVTEDGPFSHFPQIERNLTVLSGPGFTLVGGGLHLEARPLVPVAFPGDVAIAATGVSAPSDDFNVLTARHLPRPEVSVLKGEQSLLAGGLLAFLALDRGVVDGTVVDRHDLVLTRTATGLSGTFIAVRLAV